MKNNGEMTRLQISEANEYWENARDRVILTANNLGVEIELADHDDSFLYDLFDNGDYEPSDIEIADAIMEYVGGDRA